MLVDIDSILSNGDATIAPEKPKDNGLAAWNFSAKMDVGDTAISLSNTNPSAADEHSTPTASKSPHETAQMPAWRWPVHRDGSE